MKAKIESLNLSVSGFADLKVSTQFQFIEILIVNDTAASRMRRKTVGTFRA